jgi:ER degradation enhancer, mannosidase alpha-like 1
MDSFYEYLLKAYILLGGDEYWYMFDNSYQAIQKYIAGGQGFVFKNVHFETGQLMTNWIDSLAAFFPGVQVLAGDVNSAVRPHLLYDTLWQKYGALPERWNFQTKDAILEHYPLRPELIESTYMLYQATKNDYYLHVGERILNDIEKNRVKCGYVGFRNVKSKETDDRMESFFLSETLKYLFLLFDESHQVNLMDTNSIFTTGELF